MNPPRRRGAPRWRAAACALLWPAVAGAATAAIAPVSAAPKAPAQAASGTGSRVQVWLDLDLPPLATLARHDTAGRRAQRERIARQQDAVMAQLAALGATEVARVQQLRNAVAVHLPSAAVDAARRVPGVLRLRVVRDRRTDTP